MAIRIPGWASRWTSARDEDVFDNGTGGHNARKIPTLPESATGDRDAGGSGANGSDTNGSDANGSEATATGQTQDQPKQNGVYEYPATAGHATDGGDVSDWRPRSDELGTEVEASWDGSTLATGENADPSSDLERSNGAVFGGGTAGSEMLDDEIVDAEVVDLEVDSGGGALVETREQVAVVEPGVAVATTQTEVAVVEPEPTVPAVAPPAVPPAATHTPIDDADVDDGGRRRKRALIVVAIALLAAALGMVIGRRLQSPADRAASQAAPPPSLITVAVERQQLSSELVLNGEVAYNDPVAVQLAGPVGIDTDEKAVLTAVPALDDEVSEGKAVLAVTNRPVIALQGTLPMYRTISIGTTGPDVAQLETALKRLGFDPGTVDEVADAATMAAVTQLYAGAGFPAPAATATEAAALSAAKKAVTDAEANLTAARSELKKATTGAPESERMQLDRAVTAASNAIQTANANVAAVTNEQNAAVAAAQSDADAAARAFNELQNLYNTAASGAVNPESGLPYSANEVADLANQLADATSQATAARNAVGTAQSARNSAIAEANAAIDEAKFQLDLAQVQRDEAGKATDTEGASSSVTSAESAVAEAKAELTRAESAAGVRVPAGEVIFLPSLPAKVVEWSLPIGAEATGQMGAIAAAATQVTARVSRADANQVPVGSKVEIEIRDAGATSTGVVEKVGQPDTTQQQTDEFGGGQPESDGRLEVVVQPDDPATVAAYVGYSARVIISIESTGSDQLVVPVAALSVGPDGADRVEVERSAAEGDTPAKTEMVPVKVGLTANGLAAVTPVDGGLSEGDRVVIGFDYPDRRVEGDSASGDSGDGSSGGGSSGDGSGDSGDSDAAASGDGDGDSGGGDSGGGDSGGDSGDSPLMEYFGYSNDPVAQREESLALEEAIAKCMTAEGFEYTPDDYLADNADFADFGSPEFGKKYGYGIVYQYETYESEEATANTQALSPNDEYVSGLSEAEMEEYYATLYGNEIMTESDEDVEQTMPPLEDQGCYGKASAEVMGADNNVNNEKVYERVNELMTQAAEDPEAKKLASAWRDCMAEPAAAAGIDEVPEMSLDGFSGGMYDAMQKRLYEAQGATIVEVANQQEANSLEGEISMMSTDESGKGWAATGTLKPLGGDELERLRQVELELWNADQKCQDEVGLSEYQKQQEIKVVEQLESEFPETAK